MRGGSGTRRVRKNNRLTQDPCGGQPSSTDCSSRLHRSGQQGSGNSDVCTPGWSHFLEGRDSGTPHAFAAFVSSKS
jgi:hypothetical protein